MRRTAWIAGQVVVAGIVAVMVWRAIVRNWDEFRSLQVTLDLRPLWIALSVLAVCLSYAVSVEAWRRILAGWGQRLPYGQATRIWLVASLGRYIPGKVWSVAGLMVLAQRAGVSAWAAGASAVALQAVAIGTAVAVVAAATPTATSPLRLGVAALAAIGTIGILAWPGTGRLVARVTDGKATMAPLPLGAVVASAALGVLAWLVHGAAFWLLARGLGLPGTLSVVTAAGVFPLAYIMGMLALFAPGGLGVREVVLIGLLVPALGASGAVVLTVASRILLTLTEVAAPLVVLAVTRNDPKEQVRG
jgi:glycosyltransferase 2 family protein